MINEFYLIGFVQAIFFFVLIITKKNRELKDFFLAFFIFIMGLNLLYYYGYDTDFFEKRPLLILFDFAYWTLLGPLLFLYIYTATSVDKKLKPTHLLHLLPLIFVFIAFSDYIININTVTAEYQYTLLNKIGYYVFMYNSPIYYILLIFKLRKHKKNVKKYYSYTQKVDLKWLNYLTHGFAVFLVFLLAGGILYSYFNIEIPFQIGDYTWLIMVIYIFGIGFYGYKQEGVFSDFKIEETDISKKETVANKEIIKDIKAESSVNGTKTQYIKSGLSLNESKEILKQLTQFMDEKKPFLDWDLNLQTLADSIDTSTHKLSQTINESLGQSFYDFINKYRVEEVKRLLSDPKNKAYKIISLAYDAGFNSKSAFYSVFKKFTEKTPMEYRKTYLQSA